MKGPSRRAPAVPGSAVNRYSPVTNWNDDPFGADVFEPSPQYTQKKQAPPRPPPPKIHYKQPDVPVKPSHFMRRPTVLSSLLSRKNKAATNTQNVNPQPSPADLNIVLDAYNFFPKCEPKNMQTGALIDLSSPPSSPTFTTRSSSDGLSVDSFGSDATTSTNQHNQVNGGNASQAESGFEDDFDLFLHSRKAISKEDTLEDFTSSDPFSPQTVMKSVIKKKCNMSNDLFNIQLDSKNMNSIINHQTAVTFAKGPTIIRAKPARPKPPDNSALLKNTFGDTFPVTSMNINTTTPIHKICNGFGDSFDSKPFSWDEEDTPDRESSPPMPSVPPPPPPADVDVPLAWRAAADDDADGVSQGSCDDEEPHAIALFDYFTDHPDDLCFSANSRISLIRRVDAEWMYGRLRSGAEGVFPTNYVEVRVPLPEESPREPAPAPARLGYARALYDFEPVQAGDLRFRTGDTIAIMYKISDEWYFGECNGAKGQFPVNYVQMV